MNRFGEKEEKGMFRTFYIREWLGHRCKKETALLKDWNRSVY